MELNLQKLAKQMHENAKAKGFYDNKDHEFFFDAQVFEIIKEVAEFHEAYKKGKDGAGDWYLENPEEVGASVVFTACIKDAWQDELADIMIRLLDYAAFVGFGFPEYKFEKNTNESNDNYQLGFDCILLTKELIESLTKWKGKAINGIIEKIWNISNSLNCNLEWHIQAKMAYNATQNTCTCPTRNAIIMINKNNNQ